MRYGTKDIDWAEVGAMLAHVGDEEQSTFLASFCKELRTACATSYNVGMQMAYVQTINTEGIKTKYCITGLVSLLMIVKTMVFMLTIIS